MPGCPQKVMVIYSRPGRSWQQVAGDDLLHVAHAVLRQDFALGRSDDETVILGGDAPPAARSGARWSKGPTITASWWRSSGSSQIILPS